MHFKYTLMNISQFVIYVENYFKKMFIGSDIGKHAWVSNKRNKVSNTKMRDLRHKYNN